MNNHQDWTPVILSGKKPTNQNVTQKISIEEKKSDEEKARLAKNHALENETETFIIQTIPYTLSQEIIKARNAMKMSQKDVATKLNIQQSVIANYENGKAIPDNQTLQKLSKLLNTKLSIKKK